MAALPECDAYGYIYDTTGGPAVGMLVTLKRVEDSSNHPIDLEPQVAYTDAQGAYHFTLPQLATAYISARATSLWDCNGGIPFKVPAADQGELAPILIPPPEAQSFSVQPPLHYAANALSISKATASSDGYLTKEDWIRFDEGAGAMPGGVGTELQYRLDANSFGAFPSSIDAFGLTLGNYLTLNGNPLSTYHAATKNYVDQAIAAIPPSGGIPGGVINDLQLNAGGSFGASSMRQIDVDTVALLSTLTANVSGAAEGGSLRIMDVDDGAGNAQWFGLYPTYGAMNFRWEHTGTGLASREFYMHNGVSLFIMAGEWRGGHDEGHYIAMQTSDAAAGGSMNAINISGEHQVTGYLPGIYLRARCLNSGAFIGGRYNYYIDNLGINLPADPTLPLHAATKAYVDAHAGGGALPAGTATEIQYRLNGSAFGAIPGSAISTDAATSGPLTIFSSSLRLASDGVHLPSFQLETKGSVTFSVRDGAGALNPCGIFYVLHGGANAGLVYFGRSNGLITDSARVINFYTSPTGTGDVRRLYISSNGSVVVNKSSVADQTAALTVDAVGSATFSKAFQCNGIGEMSADPTTALGIVTKQYCDANAGGGSVDLAANYAWTGQHSWNSRFAITSTVVSDVLITANAGMVLAPHQPIYGFDGAATNYHLMSWNPGVAMLTIGPNAPMGGGWILLQGGLAGLYGASTILLAGDTQNAYCNFHWVFGAGYACTLGRDPVGAMEATTKQYVDGLVSAAGVASFNTRTGIVSLTSADVTTALTYTPVNKAGDTMGGFLTLTADPTNLLHASTKQYCDNKLLKSGGTMTGLLTLSGDATSALHAVSKQQSDAKHAAASANGSNAVVQTASELLTLNTGGLTTDTVANLLPAGSIILAVTARVTTTIAPGTSWKLGDATVADRFTAAISTLTAGTTATGVNQFIATRTTAGMGPDQAAAAKVRVTMTGTQPTAGAIRISVWYIQLTAPTS